MISTNQLKNGNHIEVDGTIFKVLEFQHVKPGKGGAFVRTKLRRASDGNVIDKTFRAGEKFRSVHTEARKMQFLYTDGTDAHFMDAESYEQLAIPEHAVADALRWTKPNDNVDVLFIDGSPSETGHARNRRDGAGAAVRERRRSREGPDRERRLHVARLIAPDAR
jgi:elongation factor P